MSDEAIAVVTRPTLRDSLLVGLRHGLSATMLLAKVMIPVYVIVDILHSAGVVEAMAGVVAPFMGLFGLPGEAALALLGGYLINLYAAIGAVAPLHLSPREITILGLMLGISHGLILETAITRQFAHRWQILVFFRIVLSLIAGIIANLVMP